MSSSTWTRAALSSDARHSSGRCWRLVEAQHHVSTVKLTDNGDEQDRLEALLEESKPPVPPECRHLHYLLFTPFRYGALYPRGSRFRRAGFTLGVFYASEWPRTAATEMAFHRLLFFAESPATPWPNNPAEYTAFAADYATGRSIDLREAAFAPDRASWLHPTNYEACQVLAELCRAGQIDIIKYQSVRDPRQAMNIALLSCRAFAGSEAMDRQTWRIHVSSSGARILCESPRAAHDFNREFFAADPRIAAMVWDR
jgi:hypothetical protein